MLVAMLTIISCILISIPAFPPVMFVSSSICLLLVMELGRKDRLHRSYALMVYIYNTASLQLLQ